MLRPSSYRVFQILSVPDNCQVFTHLSFVSDKLYCQLVGPPMLRWGPTCLTDNLTLRNRKRVNEKDIPGASHPAWILIHALRASWGTATRSISSRTTWPASTGSGENSGNKVLQYGEPMCSQDAMLKHSVLKYADLDLKGHTFYSKCLDLKVWQRNWGESRYPILHLYVTFLSGAKDILKCHEYSIRQIYKHKILLLNLSLRNRWHLILGGSGELVLFHFVYSCSSALSTV